MPSIADFHRAAASFAALKGAERKIAALEAELLAAKAASATDREIVVKYLEASPDAQRLLEAHWQLLKRAGVVDQPGSARKKGIAGAETAGGKSRTAAATEAAAAKRRALREADPTKKYPRSFKVRFQHFDEGLVRGYRDRTENPRAANPHNKGDRARGWALGARRADEDLAMGAVTAGVRADPPALETIRGRAEYEAELRTKAPE